MAEPTNEPTEDTPASDDAAFDESMIDPATNGESDGGADDAQKPAGSEPDAAAPDTGEINQAEIDAMMGGPTGEETPAAEAPVSPGVQEISQADIDALMGTPGSEDSASGAGDSSAPATTTAEPDKRLDSLGRPFDAAAAEMQAAMDAEKAEAAAPPTPAPATAEAPPAPVGDSLSLHEFEIPAGLDIDPKRVTMLGDVNLPVKIELGRTEMKVEDVLQLGEGSVVELDKLAGDPVDVYINSRLVARGEVLVLNDNFCVRIGEVISNDPHRVSA